MQSFQPDGAYSWLRLAISVTAGIVASVGMWAGILVLPQIQVEFATGRGGASMAYSSAMIGFAAGNLLLGRLVDRFGIAPVLAIAGILISGGFALGAMTQSMAAFSFLQLLIGFATSAGFGPLMADVSHWFVRRRGIAVAAAACGNYGAGAVWPLILKDVIADDGWRTAFWLIAAIAAAVILPLSAMLRRRPPVFAKVVDTSKPVSQPDAPIADAGMSPRVLQSLLLVAGFGCCMAMAMPQVHLVAYCSDLGYGVTAGAQMLSMMLGAGVVSRLAFGFIADYIGAVRALLIGSVAQCLALFLYLPFDGLMSLYVVSFIFGLAQGGIVPCYAMIVREYMPAREAGRRVGIVITATVIGMAAGGWASGWIYDLTRSYQAAFANGIAWNLLNIAVMIFLLTRTRRGARPRLAMA